VTEVYEWLLGGASLLHTVDAFVGDEKVEGAEIIGFDPAIGSYVTRHFGVVSSESRRGVPGRLPQPR
jgi:hypothetical protein